MKTAKAALVLLILLIVAADLIASGPVGIYGIIERVTGGCHDFNGVARSSDGVQTRTSWEPNRLV